MPKHNVLVLGINDGYDATTKQFLAIINEIVSKLTERLSSWVHLIFMRACSNWDINNPFIVVIHRGMILSYLNQ